MDIGSIRIVDNHVHHWDIARHRSWYPGIVGESEDPDTDVLGESMNGLMREYGHQQFEADTSGLDVRKIVHIAGSSSPDAYLPEAHWIAEMAANGWPAGMIGAFDPSLPMADIEASLAEQAALPGFRGVRGWFGLDPTTTKTKDIFGLFSGTGWVLDLVIRPSNARDFYSLIAGTDPSVIFVLEHSGWPETPDVDHRVIWREALELLATVPNVHCKISGLPMTLQTVEASAMRPYVEACIEVFGVQRCAVGSNFPVDRLFGTYHKLMASYFEIISELGSAAVDQLFATNTEQLYGV